MFPSLGVIAWNGGFLLVGILFWWMFRLAKTPHKKIVGDHAIVIGGSLAGLFTAAVLSKRFKKVTIIEKDVCPDGVEQRPGVPQASLLHLLLRKGLDAIEETFPGIMQEMIAKGAVESDIGASNRWYHKGGYRVQHPIGFTNLWFTRIHMEYLIRQRVSQIKNITTIDGATVTRLLPNEDGKRVVGVEFRRKKQSEEELFSDFVVDCGGRNTGIKSWLTEFKVDLPQSVINSQLGYASGTLVITEPHSWTWVYDTPIPPICNRGFIIAPTEVPNEYVATWAGYSGDHPPTDWEALLNWSKQLQIDTVEVMKTAKPKGPLIKYSKTENRRYFPERVPNWPQGLALVGDALSCFNPIYGQGMSAAILEAIALDRVLGLTQPYQLERVCSQYSVLVAKTVDEFWLLATMEDYRYNKRKLLLSINSVCV